MLPLRASIHLNIVACALNGHARQSLRLKWCTPHQMLPSEDKGYAELDIGGCRPFWLLENDADKHDVHLQGSYILTGTTKAVQSFPNLPSAKPGLDCLPMSTNLRQHAIPGMLRWFI